jgi:hypothetical protein
VSASKASRSTRSRASAPPTPDEYAAFIGQIDLLDVWLVESHVENHHGPRAPHQAGVAIASATPTYEPGGGEFSVRFSYEVRFAEGTTIHAQISIILGLLFSSQQPMTPEIFDVFKDVNLPVNTWPFLREFVSTTLGRMGWQPFTLPALKQGVPHDHDDGIEPATTKKRRRTSTRQRGTSDA